MSESDHELRTTNDDGSDATDHTRQAGLTVVVTGAAGFIGSHLVDRLLAEGHRVIGVDNFDPFYDPAIKRMNLSGAMKHDGFTLVEADIRDLPALKQALAPFISPSAANREWRPGAMPFSQAAPQRCPPPPSHASRGDSSPPMGPAPHPSLLTPPVIVHLAAKAGVRPSIEDPIAYQQTNVQGTQNMLELAREWGVRQFVFGSSSSVYGVNPMVPWTEDDHVLLPISPYAATKVAGELLGHVYSHLYSIRFIALRFFTVYGPRQRPDLAIHKFARLMMEGKPIPVYGDGTSRRDYTYVDDIVSGVVDAIAYDRSLYEIINLGNHSTVGLSEMIQSLERVLGVKALIDKYPAQPGDVVQTWADVTKASKKLSWFPRTPLDGGLGCFREWLLQGGAG